ncbi:hypothetical protein [Methylocucumis oryzae]|nr:hypothetical protein [Methylocucumis oryzae]
MKNRSYSLSAPLKAFLKPVKKWTLGGMVLGILTDLYSNPTVREYIETQNRKTALEQVLAGKAQDIHNAPLIDTYHSEVKNHHIPTAEERAAFRKEHGIPDPIPDPPQKAAPAIAPPQKPSGLKIFWDKVVIGDSLFDTHRNLFGLSLIGFVIGARKGVTRYGEAKNQLDSYYMTIKSQDDDYRQKIERYKSKPQKSKKE